MIVVSYGGGTNGLGRSFSWRSYIETRAPVCEVVDQECVCYDSSSEQ